MHKITQDELNSDLNLSSKLNGIVEVKKTLVKEA